MDPPYSSAKLLLKLDLSMINVDFPVAAIAPPSMLA